MNECKDTNATARCRPTYKADNRGEALWRSRVRVGLHNDKHSFNLKRVKKLLYLLGNPHEQFKSVLIGGTNGKGSTAVILYKILSKFDRRVGLYTSPHLTDIRERIRVADRLISKKEFSRGLSEIREVIENKWDKRTCVGKPTFFEVLNSTELITF